MNYSQFIGNTMGQREIRKMVDGILKLNTRIVHK